jgi:hypothetical protein
MTRTTRTLTALAVGAALTAALAPTANAGSDYQAASCTVGPGAVGKASSWHIGSGRYRYHLNEYGAYPYYEVGIWLDGTKVSSGQEVYRDVAGGTHKVTFRWNVAYSGIVKPVSCYRYL